MIPFQWISIFEKKYDSLLLKDLQGPVITSLPRTQNTIHKAGGISTLTIILPPPKKGSLLIG